MTYPTKIATHAHNITTEEIKGVMKDNSWIVIPTGTFINLNNFKSITLPDIGKLEVKPLSYEEITKAPKGKWLQGLYHQLDFKITEEIVEIIGDEKSEKLIYKEV